MTQQFCTMCNGYFNDPARHRYVDCPSYNGCICGKRPADIEHVNSCFMVKERKRREAHEGMNKTVPTEETVYQIPFSSTVKVPDLVVCSMCEQRYEGDPVHHRMVNCQYYNGCKLCGKKYFYRGHIKACYDSLNEPGTSTILCTICSTWIPSDKHEGHKAVCRIAIRPNPVVAMEIRMDHVPCGLCGLSYHKNDIDSHLPACKEKILSKFSEGNDPANVMDFVDLRPRKGEKVAKFKEL